MQDSSGPLPLQYCSSQFETPQNARIEFTSTVEVIRFGWEPSVPDNKLYLISGRRLHARMDTQAQQHADWVVT